MLSKEGIAVERLNSLKIDFAVNKNVGSINPLKIYGLLKQVHHIVKDKRINIIHSYSRATETLSTLYKLIFNKNIITVNTVLSLVDKRFFVEYKSDRLIAISLCLESQLINKFKIPKDRISLIYNYAESYSGDNRKKPFDNNNFVILSVGRFHKEKDFEALLKAINILNNPNVKLNLIGSGDLELNYKKYIDENKLNVTLISPKNDLSQYFLDCDICVLPSLVDPLPTFMIQSGLFKKPFIGSNVDGIAETIIDEKNGLLFSQGNSIDLADKIMMYYQNSDLMRQCANNLYELVSVKHLPAENISKIIELYNSLLKGEIS